jgi:hypothetical protein
MTKPAIDVEATGVLSLPRFRRHLNTAIMVAGGEVDVEENAKGTEIVHG